MSMLAETNKAEPGRWVIMPRKGERLMGSRERNRLRVRRRRRVVFTVLLEVTLLTLIIGLFPPLRPMLYATAALGFLVLAYLALLVKLRAGEVRLSRQRRLRMARQRMALEQAGPRWDPAPSAAGRNGNGRRSPAGYAEGSNIFAGAGYGPLGNGSNGNGAHTASRNDEFLLESGVRIIDDDVHVVVRRAVDVEAEQQLEALRAAGQ
jgi:hypothetical protein